MKTSSRADIQKQVAVLQIAERFFDSAVLFALCQTDVFKLLADGPKTLDDIHASTGGSEETLRAVLDAAVALELLSRDGGRYSASDMFLDCLGREGSPAYLAEWIAFLHSMSIPLLQLGDAVRTSSIPGASIAELGSDNVAAKTMTVAMDAYARSRGIEIASRLDFSGTRRLLDIGCGPGTYSLAIVDRYPGVRATLLDLPGPIAEARRIVAARNMTGRVDFVAADARDYVPDQPFDAILISNTLHMIGEAGSVALIRRCHGMLSPGGRLIIQAQYLNDDRTSPRWPTLVNLCQRVITRHGRNHAIGETKSWLEQAGFQNVRYVRFSLWNAMSCLVGERG